MLHKRKALFADALWAHQQEKYTLSVPLLFPIIEGTLVEKYGHLYQEGKCDKCNREFRATASPVLQKIKKEFKNSQNSILIDRYLAQIDHLLDAFSSRRNPILHGSIINYNSEELSAALILAASSLDFKDMLTG